MAADIVIRVGKIAEDLAQAGGYTWYVRTLIEACAEISRLRATVRKQQEVARMKGKQRGKRTRSVGETSSEGDA